jgi:dTDP-4-dehydrorhamnose 3,5-epimerase
MVRVTTTTIPGVSLIEPDVFRDSRGLFLETYHAHRYAEAGIPDPFVQDNFSQSMRGTLRGLHYQEPHAQGKLVMVTDGVVYDVVVDIRRGSPSFGRWYGVELSAENRHQVYVPPGCAHGFCLTSDRALFLYKCTDYYAPSGASSGTILPSPSLGRLPHPFCLPRIASTAPWLRWSQSCHGTIRPDEIRQGPIDLTRMAMLFTGGIVIRSRGR